MGGLQEMGSMKASSRRPEAGNQRRDDHLVNKVHRWPRKEDRDSNESATGGEFSFSGFVPRVVLGAIFVKTGDRLLHGDP
jgi:hypothetical protein